MKSYLLIPGVICLGIITTISVMNYNFDTDQASHSRADQYIGSVLSSYTNSSIPAHIKSLNPDNTHGVVGLDPWGKPYQYFIELKGEGLKELVITLWSKGKDAKTKLSKADVKKKSAFLPKGDDFIYSKTVKI